MKYFSSSIRNVGFGKKITENKNVYFSFSHIIFLFLKSTINIAIPLLSLNFQFSISVFQRSLKNFTNAKKEKHQKRKKKIPTLLYCLSSFSEMSVSGTNMSRSTVREKRFFIFELVIIILNITKHSLDFFYDCISHRYINTNKNGKRHQLQTFKTA